MQMWAIAGFKLINRDNLKRAKALEFTIASAIIFIHCYHAFWVIPLFLQI